MKNLTTLFRVLRALLTLMVLAAPAHALQLVLTNPDQDFQPVGAGESSGGRLTLQLVSSFEGNVMVVIRNDDGSSSTYTGVVRDGQITVQGQPLARFLAARGVTLTVQPIGGKPFTLPGLKSAPGQNKDAPGQTKDKAKK
ncbi:conserved hypothetical protein, precursor [Deinococcus maricopensis DSM 21211]|uniref:Uncharacterized protein n=2 Tax=Deinococcus TaxID=1298 RepID=E8U4L6_DEIML|nr:conserved hypothetical protein, precursor [Deinococcus maricopensis DSM 21211]